VLVDGDGMIRSQTAVGPEAIATLAVRMLGRTAGLPPRIGEPAPALALPTLSGGFARLGPAGVPKLVIFWDPACAVCAEALPELQAWDAETTEHLQLLVVSRGPLEANHAMGLRSPVLLDVADVWTRALGARGTPSSVLVDAQGAIASDIAEGMEAIRQLRLRLLPADMPSEHRDAWGQQPDRRSHGRAA
jgi:hypothetical protein